MESEEGKQRPSEVDRVFKQALREFKDNLVATYSVANRHGDTLNIKYKDLIGNFIHVSIKELLQQILSLVEFDNFFLFFGYFRL